MNLPGRRRWVVVIAGLILIQAFIRNGATPLWDEDEAAYAAFGRTMARTGDWLVPHFIWSELHRKTPLLFWCMGALFKLFGASEFLVRLPTTLAILGTIVCVGVLGRRVVNVRAAWFAALILAANPFLPNLGKIAVTDALVLLCDTGVALALASLMETADARWAVAFWAALAVGMMTKGPPTLLLAGGLVFWMLVTDSRRRTLWKLRPWFGLPLAFLPISAWVWLAWQRTAGELPKWMFHWYVAERAVGGAGFGQVRPPGFHLGLMFIGLLPWSLLLPLALARGRELWGEPRLRWLLGWLVSGWLFWELTPSKMPAYAIGAWPAVALLIGRELDRLSLDTIRSNWVRFGMALAALLSAGIVGALIYGANRFFDSTAVIEAVVATIPWMVGVALGMRALLRADVERAAVSFAIGALTLVILAWALLMPRIDARRSVGRLVAQAADSLDPTRRLPAVFTAYLHQPSIPYYVGAERRLLTSNDTVTASCEPRIEIGRGDPTAHGSNAILISGWSLDHIRSLTVSVRRNDCR